MVDVCGVKRGDSVSKALKFTQGGGFISTGSKICSRYLDVC